MTQTVSYVFVPTFPEPSHGGGVKRRNCGQITASSPARELHRPFRFCTPTPMDFRDYATKETSALLTRLLAAQSKNSVQQLQAFRKALDAATKAIESGVNASPDFDG